MGGGGHRCATVAGHDPRHSTVCKPSARLGDTRPRQQTISLIVSPINVSHDVPILCPKCEAMTSMVLYRSFNTAALMCPGCEHIWEIAPDAHPALLTIPLFFPRH